MLVGLVDFEKLSLPINLIIQPISWDLLSGLTPAQDSFIKHQKNGSATVLLSLEKTKRERKVELALITDPTSNHF